jgi:hypothetical protein
MKEIHECTAVGKRENEMTQLGNAGGGLSLGATIGMSDVQTFTGAATHPPCATD